MRFLGHAIHYSTGTSRPGAASGFSAVMTSLLTSAKSNRSNPKGRENRIRRMAARQGLRLFKCRLRDPRAAGYGGYVLADARTNAVVFGSETYGVHTLDLDDVEQYLRRD